MSGEYPDQNEPIDLSERRESAERINLSRYFELAKRDLLDTYSEFGPGGWARTFGVESQIDWGSRSDEGNIMPSVQKNKTKGTRFIQPSLQGMIEFSDISEDVAQDESIGLEAYMGVAAAKAFLAYSVEHNPSFNPSLLSGVDARSSLHQSIFDSIYTDSIVTEESMFLMTDAMTDRIQMNRAIFGLMFLSNPDKYASMKRGFEINFEREATQVDINRTTLNVLADSEQFSSKEVARWLTESFHEEWFAAAHPFSEDEVLDLFNQFESVV